MAHYGMVDTHNPEELAAWLRLAAEPGLSRAVARHLLKERGLPQQVFASTAGSLARHVPPDMAARLAAPPSPEVQKTVQEAVALLSRPNHYLITLADPGYPTALFDTGDPPILLFVRGNPDLLQRPAIAVVGARNATEAGKENARAFSHYLARRGWTIVSGLARGIDAAAHEGALAAGPGGGSTLAVLASGLDDIYPREHIPLAEEIAAHGALVTEYLPSTPAQPFRFPDRNRLVAALSRGVLVVEAAAQSGSLLTARLATECGREVFAIPGSIHAPLSRGCHALIRQGAKLVEQGLDIEEELQRTGPTPLPAIPTPHESAGFRATGGLSATAGSPYPRPPWPHDARALTPFHAPPQPYAHADASAATPRSTAPRPVTRLLKDPTVARVLTALGYDPASADQLCSRSGLDYSRIAAILTELELSDVVQRLDDGRYLRRQQGIIYD